MKIFLTSLFLFFGNISVFSQLTNIKAGLWSDPTLWINHVIPSDTDSVILNYDITIDINCACKSLNNNGNNVVINPNIEFIILENDIRDIDETIYNTVFIGTQRWLGKNLDVSRYRNGDIIPHVQDTSEWKTLTTGAWCYYENNIDSGKIYGKLYNWFAVNDPRGLAPAGWHIPTNEEWTVLINYLGGKALGGGKMKSTTGWNPPNTGATNYSNFTGLPGGQRHDFAAFNFNNIYSYGYWWTSSGISDPRFAYYITLSYTSTSAIDLGSRKEYGFSVRCVKD